MQESIPSIDTIINQKIVSLLSKLLDQKLAEHSLGNKEQPEYLSLDEAAKLLGKKPATLYNLNSQRVIPYYKNGKTIRYKRSDVEEYLTSQRISSKEEIEIKAQLQRPNRRIR